ncbi:MAG: ASCH domain-containing protein [bacterium]
MKTYPMRLHPEPFERIRSGQKTDELRLNDPKRQQIQVGDRIEFSRRPECTEKLLAEVSYLKHYPTFAEMYDGVKDRYPEASRDSFVAGMHQYYPPEEEAEFGTVEIGLRVV